MTNATMMTYRRRVWNAEELDEVEEYLRLGLSSVEIAQLMTPPTTSAAIRCMARRAGISLGTRARPSFEQVAWRKQYVKEELARRAALPKVVIPPVWRMGRSFMGKQWKRMVIDGQSGVRA